MLFVVSYFFFGICFIRCSCIRCISSSFCWNLDFFTGFVLASSICFNSFSSFTNYRIAQVWTIVINVAMK